jgi:hypothetical protein
VFLFTDTSKETSRGNRAAKRTQKHLVKEILQDSTSDRPANSTTAISHSASMIENYPLNSPENCESLVLKIKQLEENNPKQNMQSNSDASK